MRRQYLCRRVSDGAAAARFGEGCPHRRNDDDGLGHCVRKNHRAIYPGLPEGAYRIQRSNNTAAARGDRVSRNPKMRLTFPRRSSSLQPVLDPPLRPDCNGAESKTSQRPAKTGSWDRL